MIEDYFYWHDLRVFVSDEGEGQPLLLISGLGGNTEMWRPLANHIGNRRIICFDAPGTGRSATSPAPVTIARLANLAAAVLDFRQIRSADVLGYSYGGAVAQEMAYRHPTRVRKLVLAATNCGIGAVPGSLRAMQVLSTPFRYYSPTYFRRTARMAYGGRTGRNLAVRERMLTARKKSPPTSYGYAMQILGGFTWSSLPFLDRIVHDTLVISGDDDPLIPVASARMLARRIPKARLDIVDGAGHLFLWDDPENLSRRITSFLDAPAVDVPRRAVAS